ncbi:uncharacterized protein CANTADRAFT_32897, partial [Suhomyces tanzawaensis NRRL Y-17324]
LLLGLVAAHGNHGSHGAIKERPKGLSWEKWHMLEEHRIDQFSAEVFFTMHDRGSGWGRDEILNLYGIKETPGDGSGMGEGKTVISEQEKDYVVNTILNLMDTDNDQRVSLAEWKAYVGELPDFGYGQGHHLDFEAEYEEHHWKLYHANDDPDVKIKHKEDIEHELLHHEMEIESGEGGKAVEWYSDIRIEQVPLKYRAQ